MLDEWTDDGNEGILEERIICEQKGIRHGGGVSSVLDCWLESVLNTRGRKFQVLMRTERE